MPSDPEGVSFAWRIAEMEIRHKLQGVLYSGPGGFDHNDLWFRSRTEARVAQAFDDAGVLYFPLPVAVRSTTRS